MVSTLIYALFKFAARTRLSVLIPDIASRFPLTIQSFGQFADQIEMIEEMTNLHKDTVRRFGLSKNVTELTSACTKTVADRRYNSPYLKQILLKKPRFYSLCRILPVCITKVIFVDEVIRQEIYDSIKASPEFRSIANLELLKNTFPLSLNAAQRDFGIYMSAWDELD